MRGRRYWTITTGAWTVTLMLLGCGGSGGGGEDTAIEDTIEEGDAHDAADTTPADTAGDPAVEDVTADEGPGVCTSAADCDDGDPCTQDDCDTGSGDCTHEPVDADDDGYAAAEVGGTTCDGNDCDDGDGDVHPGAALDCAGTGDNDCDGLTDSDEDGDGHAPEACGGDDCDDADPFTYAGFEPVGCTADDQDCNGYEDHDNDGDGDDRESCGGGDCDDGDPDVYVGAPEDTCNGRDDNCDGEMALTEDGDQDGWANPGCGGGDCDDGDEDIHPGATEVCDLVDDDCDGSIMDAPGIDPDGDGVPAAACGGGDCDETDTTIHGAFVPPSGVTDPPVDAAAEVCDAVDDDCDGSVLDATGADDDGDTYLDEGCGGDDCDDEDGNVHPGASPDCGTDANCDGFVDGDHDGDGHLDALMCSGGDDCDDDNPDAYTGAPEICMSGADEDCDGFVDGLMLMSPPIPVTSNTSGGSERPSVTWTGSEFGVAWHESTALAGSSRLQRVDGDGTLVASDFHFASGYWPDVAWTGSDFAAAWESNAAGNDEIYVGRFDLDGTDVFADVRVTNDTGRSRWPAIVWDGSDIAVAWSDDRSGTWNIWFNRVSALGSVLLTDARISDAGSEPGAWSSIVWSGSRYGVVWEDYASGGTGGYVASVLAGGIVDGSVAPLETPHGTAISTTIAWSGSEYGSVWVDVRDGNGEIYFGRKSPSMASIGSDARLTMSTSPSIEPSTLTWTGSVYGVAWQEYDSPYYDIYFLALDGTGAIVGSDIRVTTTSVSSQNPDAVWTGSEFGIVWHDASAGHQDIYLGRVGFCQ